MRTVLMLLTLTACTDIDAPNVRDVLPLHQAEIDDTGDLGECAETGEACIQYDNEDNNCCISRHTCHWNGCGY